MTSHFLSEVNGVRPQFVTYCSSTNAPGQTRGGGGCLMRELVCFCPSGCTSLGINPVAFINLLAHRCHQHWMAGPRCHTDNWCVVVWSDNDALIPPTPTLNYFIDSREIPPCGAVCGTHSRERLSPACSKTWRLTNEQMNSMVSKLKPCVECLGLELRVRRQGHNKPNQCISVLFFLFSKNYFVIDSNSLWSNIWILTF